MMKNNELSTLASLGIVNENTVTFEFNLPQARAATVMANESWIAAGRGTGKTVGIIAPWIIHKVHEMPGSNGGLIGQTFTQLETRILQPLFLAFRQLGYKKYTPKFGGQYVYGKKPPDHWPEPLTPIEDYTKVITFYNGTTIELISLQVKGSANGKSLQWIVGDEGKYLNEIRLREEIFPILRGHVKEFGDSPWYGAKLFVTDKLHPNLHWFLNKKKLCNTKDVNTIIWYQTEVNRMYMELDSISQSEYYKRIKKIEEYEAILTAMRKNMVYYGEASALDNLANLKDDFFINMARSLTPYEFKIAILNFDPKRSEKNFYHGRTEKNMYYSAGFDDDITQPIGIALDYQASISPLVSVQVNDLVNGRDQINILKSFHVLQPLGLKHVVNDFCQYHKDRICKTVYYFYDHTATGRRNMHKKYYEEVTGYFVDNGWHVQHVYMGQASGHGIRYNMINSWLKEEASDMADKLPIGFNANENTYLILSMDQTETLEKDKGTGKNKTKETDKNFPQEEAPHHGDCLDQIVWAINGQNLWPRRTSYLDAVVVR
jgi:hypothetical protein